MRKVRANVKSGVNRRVGREKWGKKSKSGAKRKVVARKSEAKREKWG